MLGSLGTEVTRVSSIGKRWVGWADCMRWESSSGMGERTCLKE